jgi:hypothetical protein
MGCIESQPTPMTAVSSLYKKTQFSYTARPATTSRPLRGIIAAMPERNLEVANAIMIQWARRVGNARNVILTIVGCVSMQRWLRGNRSRLRKEIS